MDRVIRLADGRAMGYAEYGDPTGSVVISTHGGLVCRLDMADSADTAARCGVRLISVDRPGVGLSDALPGRNTLDWASDVQELTDHLGIGEFAVMGWSMGGQYAAAVGFAMPSRVRRVAIIAGCLPLDEPGVFDQLPTFDRVYTRLSQRAPWLAGQCFRVQALAAAVIPRPFGFLAARALGPADGAVIRDGGYADFARTTREGFRSPRGVVEEYRAWMRPWGFAPEDVSVGVDVWTGIDDALVDTRWPAQLARRFPSARLYVRSGGHFMAHLHYREIFEALK